VETIPAAVSEDAPALLPVLNQTRSVAASNQFDAGNVPWGYRYGLYQGNKLETASQIAYGRLLEEAFLPRLATRLESLLRQAPPGNADYLYQALKAYLMLGGAGPFNATGTAPWSRCRWPSARSSMNTWMRSPRTRS
jgi:type VI secretion system protein ImpL